MRMAPLAAAAITPRSDISTPERVAAARRPHHEDSIPSCADVEDLSISPAASSHSGRTLEGRALRVVSLNLGGRNTNPVEFELKGDGSEMAIEAMAVLRRVGRALRSAEEGPLFMPAAEVKLVEEILAEIFKDSVSEWHGRIRNLFQCETWSQVLMHVQTTNPNFFNALNLCTLKLDRPSVWENAGSCREMGSTVEYLTGWQQWYRGLDRSSPFWLEDAPRVAKKRNMEVSTAFAGLLIFDVMCLCTARCAVSWGCTDAITDEGREVPFKELAAFGSQLPAASLRVRHDVATAFTTGAHALLAQESRSFAKHPGVADDFLPPFCALDGFTAVFLRRGVFVDARDISAAVAKQLEALLDVQASKDVQKAWRTSASRLAAVHCQCQPRLGGFWVCLVSLHCSRSEDTAGLIESLRDVLAEYDADINIVGMDSNCSAKEAAGFQQRLLSSGFEIGCQPKQQQVTVAKQRTAMQTQVEKIGEADIAHKDYIVSWPSSAHAKVARRGQTTYTPDLRTPYGVEQETRQCVRLPTTSWPFDHCGVTTTFRRGSTCAQEVTCSRRKLGSVALLSFLLLLLLLPMYSTVTGFERRNVYQPGEWYFVGWLYSQRVCICETAAPCAEGWVHRGDSCYTTTPKLGYPEAKRFCQELDSYPVAISSEAENQFVTGLCPEGEFCYIGLQGDHAGEKSWWASGEAVNYSRVAEDERFIPLWPDSRKMDYRATVLGNLPATIKGCEPLLATTFQEVDASAAPVLFVTPPIAMLISGGILLLKRPSKQRVASWYLLMSFLINSAWFIPMIANRCYADSKVMHTLLIDLRNMIDGGGHTAQSLLALWIIVKRISLLHPSRTITGIFWALVVLVNVLFTITSLFVDNVSPLRLSWSVVALFAVLGSIIILYLVLSALMSMHLYHAWGFLAREASTGRSSQGGGMLHQQARAAKFHFASVFAAVLSGAFRWASLLLVVLGYMSTHYPHWILYVYVFTTVFDSISNDVCAHLLAVMNMDAAVIHVRGITAEVAARAAREVEQHQLAVRVLKAAPTSSEQLDQLARLEAAARAALGTEEERSSFLILQSAVRVEAARIHRLMQCVRVRAMTMPLRYQYLMEVPVVDGAPRQEVPAPFKAASPAEAEKLADSYFAWLHSESESVQQVLFQQVKQLLAKFNSTPWPSDLGLPHEEFPWTTWAPGRRQGITSRRSRKDEVLSPGDILLHRSSILQPLRRDSSALCFVLEEPTQGRVTIHRSGMPGAEEVALDELRLSGGGAVLVPGPLKKRHRCLDKVATDYEGAVPWPAAASLVDICRCMVLLDDPYSVAVFVAYLRSQMRVVRLKNRFSEDAIEIRSPQELQSMFYAAADNSDTQTHGSAASCLSADYQYRDICLNVEIMHRGVAFVCEIQVTLSNLAILKHADQKLYTIRRMKSPAELENAQTFAQH